MPAVADLHHLLRLLDDDSEIVREAVKHQLEGMKRELPDKLAQLARPLTPEEDRIMGELLASSRREDLEDNWLNWREQPNEAMQIEMALAMLAAFLSGWKTRPKQLTEQLDSLALQAAQGCVEGVNARSLATWLFASRGDGARFKGNSKDYYSPHNSNLLWVLDTGMGNPISLCVVYRLVAARLGIDIGGCNFPGHFLARVKMNGELWLVDCFNRGRFMLADDVARHHPAANPAMEEMVRQEATVESILLRFLRNLDDAYDKRGQMSERQLMRRLSVKMMGDQTD